jgi:hypothetical protein
MATLHMRVKASLWAAASGREWGHWSDPGDASESVRVIPGYLFQELLSRRPNKRWFGSPGKFRAGSKWLKHFLKHYPGQNRAMKQVAPLWSVLTRVMLQKALELLVSRVFEPPTDQKVIRSPGKFGAGSKWLKHFLKHCPGQNRAMKQVAPLSKNKWP